MHFPKVVRFTTLSRKEFVVDGIGEKIRKNCTTNGLRTRSIPSALQYIPNNRRSSMLLQHWLFLSRILSTLLLLWSLAKWPHTSSSTCWGNNKAVVNLWSSHLNRHYGPFCGDSRLYPSSLNCFCRVKLCTKRLALSRGTFFLDNSLCNRNRCRSKMSKDHTQ